MRSGGGREEICGTSTEGRGGSVVSGAAWGASWGHTILYQETLTNDEMDDACVQYLDTGKEKEKKTDEGEKGEDEKKCGRTRSYTSKRERMCACNACDMRTREYRRTDRGASLTG